MKSEEFFEYVERRWKEGNKTLLLPPGEDISYAVKTLGHALGNHRVWLEFANGEPLRCIDIGKHDIFVMDRIARSDSVIHMIKKEPVMTKTRTLRGLDFTQHVTDTIRGGGKMDEENFLYGDEFRKHVMDSIYDRYELPYLNANGKSYKVIGATDGSSSSVFKLMVIQPLNPAKLLIFEFENTSKFKYSETYKCWRPESCVATYTHHGEIVENINLYANLTDSKFLVSGLEMRFLDVWRHPVLNLLTFQFEREGEMLAYRSTRGTTLRIRRVYHEEGFSHEILLDHVKRMDLD